MEKSITISYFLILSCIISIIFHNFLSLLLSHEEAVFFFLSGFLFIAFFISILVNVLTYLRFRKPKDIYKLGFLGFLGVIGAIIRFSPVFYAFLGFFAFLPLKKRGFNKKIFFLGLFFILFVFNWAAIHDILQGEPNPIQEFIIILSTLLFVILTLIY